MATIWNRFANYMLVGILERMPLKDMGPALTVLATKVYTHRLGHKGYVPIEVFEQLLGPVTVSVQIVHVVLDQNMRNIGFALRLRDADEAGDAYRGKYHNTCTSLRWLDNLESALRRNDGDVLGDASGRTIEMGVTLHHETPRRNMDLTFMYQRGVFESEVSSFRGTWKMFTYAEIAAMVGKPGSELPIVESNLHQLLWVMDPNRPAFGVLKDSFPKQLLP